VLTGNYRDANENIRYENASEDRMAFADKLLEIGDLSDFQLGFPWSFLHEEYVLELIHGKTYPNLDIHR